MSLDHDDRGHCQCCDWYSDQSVPYEWLTKIRCAAGAMTRPVYNGPPISEYEAVPFYAGSGQWMRWGTS